MAITVSITGAAEVQRAIRNLANLAPQKLKAAVEDSTVTIHGEARRNVTTDVGFLKNSIDFEVTTSSGITGEVRVGSSYGPYVEFGTKPHFPPVAPLEEWARRHGMPPGTGYLIARKIAQTGTVAQPFLFPAAEAERNRFFDAIRAALVASVREA
jgi:hypothetical protein